MDQTYQIAPEAKTKLYVFCVVAFVVLMPTRHAQATINDGVWKFTGDGPSVLYRRERSEGGDNHSSSDDDGDDDHSGSSDRDDDGGSGGKSSSSGSNSSSGRGTSERDAGRDDVFRTRKRGRDNGYDLIELLKQLWR